MGGSGKQAVKLESLSRDFNEIQALRCISLEVEYGQLFGIVGPDGAGKTTLIRILAGLLNITDGDGSVAGFDLRKSPEKVKKKIGYMAQQFGLYAELNVEENLVFFADLFDVPKGELDSRMDSLLRFANLTDFRKRRADKLSGGMQKKLALACCLIHQPEILLLDEPTTGVDPISRREFWHILSQLNLRGTTIIVSTPYMDEADRCSKVGLLFEGEMIRCDTPEAIRNSVPGEMLVLVPDTEVDITELLESIEGIFEIQSYGDAYHLLVKNAKKQQREINKQLKREKIGIQDLYESIPKMEQAFISLVNKLE